MLICAGCNTDVSFDSALEDVDLPTLRMSAKKEADYQAEILSLQRQLAILKGQLAAVTQERDASYFGVHWIAGDDQKTRFYTGLPTYQLFQLFCEYLSEKAEHLKAWQGAEKTRPATNNHSGPRPWKDMTIPNQLFAVLVRLRLGLCAADAAARFRMSEATYSRLFTTWILFLSKELDLLFPWPSRTQVDAFMPDSFKKKFPTTRVVIDCMEIQIERPTSLLGQSKTYSNYKSRNTMKFLVGVSPSGLVTHVSDAWGGRVSDKAITDQSGIIQKLDRGDSVMADKGFDIEDLLAPHGVKLNVPPKLGGDGQLSAQKIEKTRRIAELRIHVERAIGRARNYSILNQVFPMSMSSLASAIVFVCFYLTNFDEPLVK